MFADRNSKIFPILCFSETETERETLVLWPVGGGFFFFFLLLLLLFFLASSRKQRILFSFPILLSPYLSLFLKQRQREAERHLPTPLSLCFFNSSSSFCLLMKMLLFWSGVSFIFVHFSEAFCLSLSLSFSGYIIGIFEEPIFFGLSWKPKDASLLALTTGMSSFSSMPTRLLEYVLLFSFSFLFFPFLSSIDAPSLHFEDILFEL